MSSPVGISKVGRAGQLIENDFSVANFTFENFVNFQYCGWLAGPQFTPAGFHVDFPHPGRLPKKLKSYLTVKLIGPVADSGPRKKQPGTRSKAM